MKKLIVFIVLVMASLNGFAYEKGIGGYVEVGQSFLPVETYYTDSDGFESKQYIAYTDINLHYVFQFWNIQFIPFTSIKTWAIPSITQMNGKPFCDIYTIGGEIKYNNISLTVDHYCAHPVYSKPQIWEVRDYRMGQNMTEMKLRYNFN